MLAALQFDFDVRSSAEMVDTELAPYAFVIIPGAQWQDNFYRDYRPTKAGFWRPANVFTTGMDRAAAL